jgi:hypothetical protein
MAKQLVRVGDAPNDGNGDELRSAFIKINDNFNEVYSSYGDGTDLNASEDNTTNVEFTGEVKATGGFTYATGSTTPARESGTTGLQFWAGTQAQYDALTTDSDTLYIIT